MGMDLLGDHGDERFNALGWRECLEHAIEFGGEAGQNFQFVSNAFINQPSLPPVPLPGALPLFAGGLGALGFAGLAQEKESGSNRCVIKTAT